MSVSPELALAAAAAIKDKALEEQTKELLYLREQLHASQEIEITGRGVPVYCRGSFQDGNFRESNMSIHNSRETYWEVTFECTDSYADGIPLRNFWEDMEIRIGGVVWTTTAKVSGRLCRVSGAVRGAASSEIRADIVCPILPDQTATISWMEINFRSLPEGPWKYLRSCAMFNEQAFTDLEDLFHKISHPTQIPQRLPKQRADVASIMFYGRDVLKLIKTVRRDAEFERMKEEKVAKIEKFRDYLNRTT